MMPVFAPYWGRFPWWGGPRTPRYHGPPGCLPRKSRAAHGPATLRCTVLRDLLGLCLFLFCQVFLGWMLFSCCALLLSLRLECCLFLCPSRPDPCLIQCLLSFFFFLWLFGMVADDFFFLSLSLSLAFQFFFFSFSLSLSQALGKPKPVLGFGVPLVALWPRQHGNC